MILNWTLVYGVITIFIGALLLAAVFISGCRCKWPTTLNFFGLIIWTCVAVTIIFYGIRLIKDDLKSHNTPETKIEKVIPETKENLK
jgi:hypothetical protein